MKLINLNNMTTINQQNPDLDGNRKTNTPHIMEKGRSIDNATHGPCKSYRSIEFFV